ncbi:MAG: hypothetical protein L6R35_007214 [Caloplaca aegaea]|nr:MAG: hypothetical protein L6R35_007214 [Caloplaca aegaea]
MSSSSSSAYFRSISSGNNLLADWGSPGAGLKGFRRGMAAAIADLGFEADHSEDGGRTRWD